MEHLELDAARRVVSSKQVIQFELEHQDIAKSQFAVLALAGELDLTNATELEERLESVISSNGPSLVLDLTRVAFIDSAALHVLFRTARRLGKKRFGLVVQPVSAISRALDIVGISEVATLGSSFDDLRTALSPA